MNDKKMITEKKNINKVNIKSVKKETVIYNKRK